MNSTLQVLRAIPELQTALSSYNPASSSQVLVHEQRAEGHPGLTRALRDMYASLRSTAVAFTPKAFVDMLRQAVPQFNERQTVSKSGINLSGYAQQDAEECWVQILNALKTLEGAKSSGANEGRNKFIEQYMMGEMRREYVVPFVLLILNRLLMLFFPINHRLKCDEAPEEEPSISSEKVLKLECNIAINTNFLHSGIMDVSEYFYII